LPNSEAEKEDETNSEPRKKRNRDKESGVARGIDFQFVSNVINFDFPLNSLSYWHRVGRTARGNNKVILHFALNNFLSKIPVFCFCNAGKGRIV